MPVDIMVRAYKDEAFRSTVDAPGHPSGNIEDELDQILKLGTPGRQLSTHSGTTIESGALCCC